MAKKNPQKTGNLKRLIIRSETEFVIKKKKPENKSPGLDGFTGEFYETYTKEVIPILKLFQKCKRLGHSQIHITSLSLP